MEHDMNHDQERHRRIGEAFEALRIDQKIQGYYYARGDWHIDTIDGQRHVLTARQVPGYLRQHQEARA